jgi:ankyrin repeat protein
VNNVDGDGSTPLLDAVVHEHPDVIELLLDLGADVNAQNTRSGSTALHQAVKTGNVEIVRMLLVRDVDRSLIDGDGRTALDLAINDGDEDIIDLFRYTHIW